MVGAEPMVSALVRLSRDNASTLTTDPLYALVNFSHPPVPLAGSAAASGLNTEAGLAAHGTETLERRLVARFRLWPRRRGRYSRLERGAVVQPPLPVTVARPPAQDFPKLRGLALVPA